MISLEETINEIATWPHSKQVRFCQLISLNITISIRVLLAAEEETTEQKLEGIKWLNEFHHRLINIQSDIIAKRKGSDHIKGITKNARYYASKSPLTKGTISEAIRHSLDAIKRIKEPPRRYIFDLLKSKDFRSKTAMYIGARKISTLNAFLTGYFHASYDFEVPIPETGPDFGGFHDWVANYYGWKESTAGWKNIILKEANGNEENALDAFFVLYDKFKGMNQERNA